MSKASTQDRIVIVGAGHNGLVAACYLAKAGLRPLVLERRGVVGGAVAPLMSRTPPSVDSPTLGDLWNLGKLGKDFRGLGKRDAYRLLRWGPMAVADLVAEWFETELLRAAVAARGITGAFAGPWSAGTSLGLLVQAAFDGQPLAPASFVRGGMGALTQALADA